MLSWLATRQRNEAPVEIMIAQPFALPDTPLPLDGLETAVFTWGMTVMQQVFAEAWTAQAAVRSCVGCPVCAHTVVRRAGMRMRQVETRFGPVILRRQRMCCTGCGRYWQPDDALLTPVLGAGRCTPQVRELAALCGASWPFAQAAAVLAMLRGTPLARETVRRLTGVAGAIVAAQHAVAAVAACTPPATIPAPPTAPVPSLLDGALDGAWVHCRDATRGMEIKVGVTHTGSERCGATRTRLPVRRYAATAQGVAAFGPLVTATIAHLDGYGCTEQTLLGDGAEWIWRLGRAMLPDATPVLDRWHLRDARRRATRAALPDAALRAPWSAQLEAALEAGAVDDARAVLTQMAQQFPHPALPAFADFLDHQRERIPDYAARRAAGKAIGSGVVEKGVDVVVNRRMKGKRGMRWRRGQAEGMVALRVARLNDEWEANLTAARLPPP